MKVALALVSVLALGACNKGPSTTQCQQLLEKLADMEVAKAGATGAGSDAPTAAMKDESQKSKAALVEAKKDEFISMCKDKIATTKIDCALNAKDLDAVAKCDAQ